MAEDATDKKIEDVPEVEVTAKDLSSPDDGEKAAEDTPKKEIEISGDGAEAKPTDGKPTESKPTEGKPIDANPAMDRRPAGDGGGRGHGSYHYDDRSRPMSNDEKLKRYKKQSEERLLDIKRSREAKIGKRRGR